MSLYSFIYIIDKYIGTLLFYYLCCHRLGFPSFGAFSVLLVSCPIPDFYAKIPAFSAKIPCYLGSYARYCAWCMVVLCVCGGGSLGGILGLTHVFSRACSLTCQPDSRFQIPARLPFLQGPGDPSSTGHP